MEYKTTEEYLWELKMTFIKALPTLLVGSIALSQIFSSSELAKNFYLLFAFVIWIFFLLAIAEAIMFGVTGRPRKSRTK